MAFIPVYTVRVGSERVTTRSITSAEAAATVIWNYLKGADREHFVALALDTKGKGLGLHTVAIGSLDEVCVHPREIFKFAIAVNVASIIVAHNHPSGNPQPSPIDRQLTRRLIEAGRLLGIPVLDHIVLGQAPDEFVSLAESDSGMQHLWASES